MSTSVYPSEQVVHYGGTPVTYYGFYISWSGGEDDSAYPFQDAARRREWVKTVQAAMPGSDDYYLAAAMLACATWGPESGRDGIAWVFDERYEDEAEALNDLAAGFDPSEPGVAR